ncbi:hypothetical protein [Kineosporia sp. R_H_3]|uniref:hypothetical protein n=1 Tax=Kineosporia sp. R_H_3 TaxID=1961848 RepID=UPI00117A576D|nr:hypothetical protein [Kineosporia sp. R_H_3]
MLDDARVRLLVPRDVRGLEFDGVVVVDPGLFPRSVDKEGPLYTSLTRANRELVVVHSRGLPAKLRRVLGPPDRHGRSSVSATVTPASRDAYSTR